MAEPAIPATSAVPATDHVAPPAPAITAEDVVALRNNYNSLAAELRRIKEAGTPKPAPEAEITMAQRVKALEAEQTELARERRIAAIERAEKDCDIVQVCKRSGHSPMYKLVTKADKLRIADEMRQKQQGVLL